MPLEPGAPGYPQLLRAVPSPPALWVRGALAAEDALAVAIVGSRRATPYGLATAERIAAELAARGVTIVSGLARGIDTAAHRGALEAGAGRSRCSAAASTSCIRGEPRARPGDRGSGALLSQFAPGTPALPGHFPARNRTLAGLALGVLVVEAAERSGALITAGFAGDLGRECSPFQAELPPIRRPARTGSSRTVLNSLVAGRISCQNCRNRGGARCAAL